MKKFWNVIACIAFVNVLALAGLAGWLGATDRLSRGRMEALRTLFTRTNAEEAQARSAEAAKAQEQVQSAMQAEKLARPPVPAAGTIEENRAEADRQLQLAMRREREVETLRESLSAQVASLERRDKQLAADRAVFEAEKKRIVEVDGSGQFKAALTTLEALRAQDAKMLLGAMLAGREVDQVVAYLARMDEGKRAKVLAEFVKEDPAVAAELLERLRTRGVTGTPTGPIAANDAKPVQPHPSAQR